MKKILIMLLLSNILFGFDLFNQSKELAYDKMCNIVDNADSCNKLGKMYANSSYANQSNLKSIKLFTKACYNLENAQGCVELGKLLLHGKTYDPKDSDVTYDLNQC